MCSHNETDITPTNDSISGLSSQDAKDINVLSVNIYGQGEPEKEDSPTHWAIMIFKPGETVGDRYHVRKDLEFYYDTQRLPVESVSLYGRCELTQLSNTRRLRAARLLEAYGNETANLPKGSQNCHDWTVGALGVLEEANLTPKGTEEYWACQIGKGPISIGRQLVEDGKPWVLKSIVEPAQKSPADATFGKTEESKPIGRLNLEDFAHLLGGAKKG
ncbi:hypothetical protein ASPBRDRAFT_34893 [Aspergillus brasiliensis CBS 101740]|uniref:Uncharacterized protein n=1 Tax=Aspergillus brasiliensis (strain CBS 101740 / IMI 381727 / IBT 21946) TaxID=767769 RepID=A0A1L9U530_ASPBC|nr:hypothetical protein ASPBRDRAFT_34893 [Aspergillus brasiliensis CBS 101740]